MTSIKKEAPYPTMKWSMELQPNILETVSASIIRVDVMNDMTVSFIPTLCSYSPVGADRMGSHIIHHINPDDGGTDSLQNT
jgi:hypothetical protein